jgi:methyl-accepting chemotaxis protein
MIKTLFGKSIGYKFLGVISVVLLISAIVTSVLLARHESELLRRSLEDKGNSLIAYVAKLSTDPMTMNDLYQLDSIVNEVNRNEDVLYTVIRNASGTIMTSPVSSMNTRRPDTEKLIRDLPKNSELSEIISALSKSGKAVELSAPIIREAETIGTATIGMTDQMIRKQTARTLFFVFILNLATALLLGAVLVAASRRIVINPIANLTAVTRLLASGDLSQKIDVKTDDEIGELSRTMNKMIADLRELISSIRETASKTVSSAEQIVNGSQQVKQGATSTSQVAEETLTSMEEMASSIRSVSENVGAVSTSVDETSLSVSHMMASVESVANNMDTLASTVSSTSSTVEEMTMSIEEVARNTDNLSQVVKNAAASVEHMVKSVENISGHIYEAGTITQRSVDEAKAGGAALDSAFQSMKQITGTMGNMASLIENLGKSSQEIGMILKVIDEIADQTSLLALNAAILASQAGEHGKGFSVVAGEIRDLAERSIKATQEIGDVIKRVQGETQNAVESTKKGARMAAESMGMSDRAAAALKKIIEGVEQTGAIMGKIMESTMEQRSISNETLSFVNTMRISSDQVKKAMTEQAAGGKQIRLSVENMNRIMQEVRQAARDQAEGSKQINNAIENMNEMTRQVMLAMSEQKTGGDLVVKSTENISTIANDNLAAVEKMAKSTNELVEESFALMQNVERFKT